MSRHPSVSAAIVALVTLTALSEPPAARAQIGVEKGLPHHLEDGEEYRLSLSELLRHGKRVFSASWTSSDGFGRPRTKGVGSALSDPNDPLVFPRNMNRISAPDANSCAGCHNLPRAGGGGDFVANVFVLGQRFDFATFDPVPDGFLTKGTTDERGLSPALQQVANSRNTPGMFGSGYIEMLARVLTGELQAVRDGLLPGSAAPLLARGISFGVLARNPDGSFDTAGVTGLPAPSIESAGGAPPSLMIMPFHQAGAVISLRQFTNNAFNHHHGLQSTERFGSGVDPDDDGVVDELTRADITAVTLWQAALPVPGRVIPDDPRVEKAVRNGEIHFVAIGCAECHIPELPLVTTESHFTEPGPFNPAGNLQPGDVPSPLVMSLNSKRLARPRLRARKGVTWVPAFTDLRLHDICSGPDDPNGEALDMHQAGTAGMFDGNRKFLTKKLWGAASEPPYFHHGQFTTLRRSILAHAGEAQASTDSYLDLSPHEQDELIEFLKTLRILPAGSRHLIVNEKGRRKNWPEFPYDRYRHLP